ncbi:unnamed protein product [Allacma fusca]|uniref:Long-chain-fatty-acid--CoA ligase n=1 Tax=Allacma fusca TaxID=39272 RepID=A0A8J2LQW6_9HEXA|nr:unnamed protein product [Allacma fusca]
MANLKENQHDQKHLRQSVNTCCNSAYCETKLQQGETEAPVSLNKQSFLLPGPERIHISMLEKYKPENFTEPFYLYQDVRTAYDIIRKGLARSNNGNCLGYRPDDRSDYIWLSYQIVLNRCVNFGRGLHHLGVKEKEFVGIYSKNRVEWVLAEQGIYSFSMVSVPLYDTLGPTACHFIITQAEITTVVLETEKNLLSILENIPTCLKTIIYMNELSSETIVRAEKLGLKLFKFMEVEQIGQEQQDLYPEKPPKPDDIATLSYTSGTTGTPKGVIITHSSFVSSICCSIASFRRFHQDLMTKDDVLFSYLPLAHVYEKGMEAIALIEGASIGFYRGDVLTLLDDIKFLKPTVFPTVPRLLNRVYDKVMGAANQSSLKRFLVKTALRYKRKEVEQNIRRRNSIWDHLVFGKIQNALGGRVRMVVSGGSAINADVLSFFRCALGCQVVEAYGQTESSGLISVTLPHDTNGGHIGPPILGVAVKLVDVPEMNYYSKNDQGEICIKSSGICKGYYKNDEETQKAIDEDGWLHTGDIATWLQNGTVKIIDRKKNIFKLSQGEYVAPEKIEIVYAFCPFVAQIFIYGDSLEDFLVGIVVPDAEVLKAMYPAATDMLSLCKDRNVKAMIFNELTKLGRENGLKSFEQVKNIYLHPELFTIEQDLLTPTMKLKRPELKTFFEPQIKQMYNLA